MAPSASTPKIEELRFRIKTDPKSRLFYPLAEELRKISQFGEAEQVLRAGLAIHATYLSGWVSLGRVLRETGKNHEAAEALSKALLLDPGNVVVAKLLAETYMALGEKVEAIKKYKLVHALLPSDQEIEGIIAALEVELKGDDLPAPATLSSEPSTGGAGLTGADSLPGTVSRDEPADSPEPAMPSAGPAAASESQPSDDPFGEPALSSSSAQADSGDSPETKRAGAENDFPFGRTEDSQTLAGRDDDSDGPAAPFASADVSPFGDAAEESPFDVTSRAARRPAGFANQPATSASATSDDVAGSGPQIDRTSSDDMIPASGHGLGAPSEDDSPAVELPFPGDDTNSHSDDQTVAVSEREAMPTLSSSFPPAGFREEQDVATGDDEPMSVAHTSSPFEEPAGDLGYGSDAFAIEKPEGMHTGRAPLIADVPSTFDEDALPPVEPLTALPRSFAPTADESDAEPYMTHGIASDLPFALDTELAPPDSDDFAKTITMADLYAGQGLIDEARDIYEDVLARDPGNALVRAKLAAIQPQPLMDSPSAIEGSAQTGSDAGPAATIKIAKLEAWLSRVRGREVRDV